MHMTDLPGQSSDAIGSSTDQSAADSVELWEFEEPLCDTRDLLLAANMAAGDMKDLRSEALRAVIDAARDKLAIVHNLWERMPKVQS